MVSVAVQTEDALCRCVDCNERLYVKINGERYPREWFWIPVVGSPHQHLKPRGYFNCFDFDHRYNVCKKPLRVFCFVCARTGVKFPECPCCHAKKWHLQ